MLLSSTCFSEQVKTVFNPFTNKQDYITKIDSNTIQPGSGVTVTSLSTGAVIISATGGGGSGTSCGSNPAGLQFSDSASCTWCTTVGTNGNLITTLLSCPVVVADRCRYTQPIGLLLALQGCPNEGK